MTSYNQQSRMTANKTWYIDIENSITVYQEESARYSCPRHDFDENACNIGMLLVSLESSGGGIALLSIIAFRRWTAQGQEGFVVTE